MQGCWGDADTHVCMCVHVCYVCACVLCVCMCVCVMCVCMCICVRACTGHREEMGDCLEQGSRLV